MPFDVTFLQVALIIYAFGGLATAVFYSYLVIGRYQNLPVWYVGAAMVGMFLLWPILIIKWVVLGINWITQQALRRLAGPVQPNKKKGNGKNDYAN